MRIKMTAAAMIATVVACAGIVHGAVTKVTGETLPVPHDTMSFLMTPDALPVAQDVSAGVQYANYRNVANVELSGTRVHSDGYDGFVSFGYKSFQFGYEHSKYELARTSPVMPQMQDNIQADGLRVKYVFSPEAYDFPMKNSTAVGVIYVTQKGGAARTEIYQPFVAVDVEYGRKFDATIGVNYLTGDMDDKAGVFGSARYSFSDGVMTYLDFNTVDYHKAVINEAIIPYSGVLCSSCSQRSVTSGVIFRIGTAGYANVGMYDISDLSAPFATMVFKLDYR